MLVVLVIGVTFIAGCQDKKSDPPSALPSPSPVVLIPKTTPGGGGGATAPGSIDAPVSGQVMGVPFKPDAITLQGTSLTFRTGKDFFADQEISFFLPENSGPKLEGKSFKFGGKNFLDPMVHVKRKEGKSTFPETEVVSASDYTMTLKFDKHTATTAEGTIDLRVTKPANTHLIGKFIATVKKTGYEPLEKDDAPYVHGKILMKGDWKEASISVGFVGKASDGKQPSNMIGFGIKRGGSETGASTSFYPQITSIINTKDSPTYRHTRMAPGDYFVYVRREGVVAAWKSISVKAGNELNVDLTIDLANTGSLVATLPDEEVNDFAEWRLQVIPAGIDIPGGTFNFAFDTVDVKKGQKTATVKEVPAGKYKVARGKSEAEVEVVAGKTAMVTLVRKDPKK
jgi:hypothetical protein